jgi:zinc protease
MQTTLPTEAEMQQAVAMLLREIPLQQASVSNIADGYLARAVVGLPLDEPVRAAERYQAITAEQVRAAFAKWIRLPDIVQIVQGPPPK